MFFCIVGLARIWLLSDRCLHGMCVLHMQPEPIWSFSHPLQPGGLVHAHAASRRPAERLFGRDLQALGAALTAAPQCFVVGIHVAIYSIQHASFLRSAKEGTKGVKAEFNRVNLIGACALLCAVPGPRQRRVPGAASVSKCAVLHGRLQGRAMPAAANTCCSITGPSRPWLPLLPAPARWAAWRRRRSCAGCPGSRRRPCARAPLQAPCRLPLRRQPQPSRRPPRPCRPQLQHGRLGEPGAGGRVNGARRAAVRGGRAAGSMPVPISPIPSAPAHNRRSSHAPCTSAIA